MPTTLVRNAAWAVVWDAARARHVYERAGFVHEGTLRDALLIDGTWVDAHVMGILADEWRERHGRS